MSPPGQQFLSSVAIHTHNAVRASGRAWDLSGISLFTSIMENQGKFYGERR
jgi:hypothetical protein